MEDQGISPSYQMRSFVITPVTEYPHAESIKTTLNLQHNCRKGHCHRILSQKAPRANQEGTLIVYHIQHTELKSYILNTASFHSPVEHRKMANICTTTPAPTQRLAAVELGTRKWKSEPKMVAKNPDDNDTSESDSITSRQGVHSRNVSVASS
jgi:hypothetical protein